jgi:hypothetical protein
MRIALAGHGAKPWGSLPPGGSARPSRVACNALVDLCTLDHYHLRLDRKCRLLYAKRTTAPFECIGDIRRCFSQIEAKLADIPRGHYALLVDTRVGPSRNDRGFELVLEEERGKLLFGFAKNGALAATAVGRLQIQRFAKKDGREVLASDDPAEIFQYLGLPPHWV